MCRQLRWPEAKSRRRRDQQPAGIHSPWDARRVTGRAGIGWQDLRTVGYCLALQAQGIRLAPNQSATKLAVLLDISDPDRSRDLCAGTVDSWVAWTLPVAACMCRPEQTSPSPDYLTAMLRNGTT